MEIAIIGIIMAINNHTYLPDIYGHPAEWEGGVELKELTQQLL